MTEEEMETPLLGEAPVKTHAEVRKAQRGVKPEAVDYALDYGTRYRIQGNRTAYFLGTKAIKKAKKDGLNLSDYSNVCVITANNGALVTVLRCDRPSDIYGLKG